MLRFRNFCKDKSLGVAESAAFLKRWSREITLLVNGLNDRSMYSSSIILNYA